MQRTGKTCRYLPGCGGLNEKRQKAGVTGDKEPAEQERHGLGMAGDEDGIRLGICDVCTGCGRCAGRQQGMKVVTASGFGGSVKLHNKKGIRLVTADVGSTTIAMQLHREDGSVEADYVTVNPQTVYGADVISRIQAAENRMHALAMQRAVRNELEKGIEQFRQKLAEGEGLQMVLAGNTTMIYLLMGYDTMQLGQAPFHAGHLGAVETQIGGIPCHIIEGLSAFVGGDITAGILACGILESREPVLLIDLGTNGEMALGCTEYLTVCSTAAGPAFEGGVSRGIWGADMVSILAGLRRKGLVDETGLLQEPYFTTGIRIRGVKVSQSSIRAVQLAKAAIMAGIKILLQQHGMEAEDVGRLVLAGGFGYYLKPEDAQEIGLIPQALAGKAVSGGNTALGGALRTGEKLLAGDSANILEDTGITAESLDLAQHPSFQEYFVDAMEIRKV